MNMNDAFPSKYLKAADLKGQRVRVTMEDVNMASFDSGDEPKPCVVFRGKKKGLVLNKTNSNTIVDIYGPDTDAWFGKDITIYPTTTEYQGRMADCIRVQVESRQTSQPGFVGQPDATSQVAPPVQSSTVPEPAPSSEGLDDIPF